jgi:outer membrane immunogenic protein
MRKLGSSIVAALSVAFIGGWTTDSQAQVFQTGPWSGLYLGGHGGYGWESGSGSGLQGATYGVQAGYNLQLGPAVLGVEADYSWSDAKDTGVSGLTNWTARLDSMWSVRARLGAMIGSNVLLYGTAGYGAYDISLTGRIVTPLVAGNISASAYTSSFVVGGGAELLLTRNIMLRAEALHFTRGADELVVDTGGLTVLRLGASYKF